MIILFQSVTVQFCKLFWHISYYKVWKSNFITKCDRLLLQSLSGITKSDRLCYEVRQVLQSVTIITKWDVTLGSRDWIIWTLSVKILLTKDEKVF